MTMNAEQLATKLRTIRDLSNALFNTTDELIRELVTSEEEEVLTKCPHCGSPKLSDVSGMGPPEFKCNDCKQITQGELVK